MANNTGNWIGRQIRYSREAKKRDEKERESYNISWECESISEKGNKILYYIALAIFGIPILLMLIWWGVVTETGDLGTFFSGIGFLYLLIPLAMIGLILIAVSYGIRAKCREKTQK